MIYKSIISIRQFQEHIIGDGSGGLPEKRGLWGVREARQIWSLFEIV